MTQEGLYDRGYVIYFKEGDKAFYRTPIIYVASVYDKYHTIRDGETLLSIALDKFGASSLWFMIADVNDDVEDIFDLEVGSTLLIPNLEFIQSQYARSF